MLSTRISEAEVGQTAYHIPSDNDCEYTAVTAIVQPSKRNKKREMGREKKRRIEKKRWRSLRKKVTASNPLYSITLKSSQIKSNQVN